MSLRKKNGSFLQFYIRKEETSIFHFDKSRTSSRITIGVTGCCSGIGVTHISIALCSFCASKLGKKTAFLEFHGRDEISQFFRDESPAASDSADGRQPCFHASGVDYYSNLSSHDIPILLNKGYQYLIFDMGSFPEADFQEFLRCDRKLILGSLAPWKTRTWQNFFQYKNKSVNSGEGFYYLLQMGNSKDFLSFSKTYQISRQSMLQIPFIKNPFCIGKELFVFFEELLSTH